MIGRTVRRLACCAGAVVPLLAGALAVAAPAAAEIIYPITATVPVGPGPQPVTTDPTRQLVFVGNTGDATVSIVDAGTYTVTATIALPAAPRALAVDPTVHRLYALTANGVLAIGELNHRVLTNRPGDDGSALTVDPVTHHVYLANYGGGTVDVLNRRLATLTEVPVGDGPAALAVDPGLHRVYVGSTYANAVAIDTTDDTVTPLAAGGPDSGVVSVAVDPFDHTLYVGQLLDNLVSAYAEPSDAGRYIDRDADGGPFALTADPQRHVAYVVGSQLSVFDPGLGFVASAAAGDSPTQGVVDARTGVLWVTESADATAIAITPTYRRTPQTITWVYPPPRAATVGTTSFVAAYGGLSGNPVVIGPPPGRDESSVCTFDSQDEEATITYVGPGRCVVLVHQAGNAQYAGSPTVRAVVRVRH